MSLMSIFFQCLLIESMVGMRNYQKGDMFYKMSTRCTSIEGDLWPLLGSIFTPQPSKNALVSPGTV